MPAALTGITYFLIIPGHNESRIRKVLDGSRTFENICKQKSKSNGVVVKQLHNLIYLNEINLKHVSSSINPHMISWQSE
jgi:hypothetical protein